MDDDEDEDGTLNDLYDQVTRRLLMSDREYSFSATHRAMQAHLSGDVDALRRELDALEAPSRPHVTAQTMDSVDYSSVEARFQALDYGRRIEASVGPIRPVGEAAREYAPRPRKKKKKKKKGSTPCAVGPGRWPSVLVMVLRRSVYTVP